MYQHARAEKVIAFQRACYASIGLALPKFHEAWTRRIYGLVDDEGTRIINRALVTIPRKNAKSTYVASLCLYHCIADGEPYPRIYIAATVLKQAGEIFDIMTRMIEADPFLYKNFRVKNTKVSKEAIYYRNGKKHGTIEALTKTGTAAEGLNPSFVAMDELGKWGPSHRVLWDSLTSGSMARKQPLFFMISTSADENEGILFEQVHHAKQVLAGEKKDDELFAYILEADPAKWDQEAEWVRVNPLVAEGFVKVEKLRSLYQSGLVSDHDMHRFKRKHLNMWVGSNFAFLNMSAWRENTRPIVEANLVGLPVVGAIDLSSNKDFSSLVLLFDDKQPNGTHIYHVKPYFWLPEVGIRERGKKDGMDYDRWRQTNMLDVSPGEFIDYHLILNKLKQLKTQYPNLREIAYDRYRADYLLQDLTAAGFDVSDFNQSIKGMTAPMRELSNVVLDRRLVHGNHEILTWQATRLLAKEDESERVKPNRKGVTKIDGIVALLMCLGTLMRHQQTGQLKSALGRFM